MPGNTQMRRPVSLSTPETPAPMSTPLVTTPAYMSPAPPLMSAMPEADAGALGLCPIPGHEDRAAPDTPPLTEEPAARSEAEPPPTQSTTPAVQSSVPEAQSSPAPPLETAGPEADDTAERHAPRSAGRPAREAPADRRRAPRRSARRPEDNGEALVIPPLALAPMAALPPAPFLPLALPPPLRAVARPSAGLGKIEADDPESLRQAEAARAEADRRFEGVALATRQRAADQARAATAAGRRIAAAAEQAIATLRRDTATSDMEVEQAARAADDRLTALAEERKTHIRRRHFLARRSLAAAKKAAEEAITKADGETTRHIGNVLYDHAQAYAEKDRDAIRRVMAKRAHAKTKIADFRSRAQAPEELSDAPPRPTKGKRLLQIDVNKALGDRLADAANARVDTLTDGPGEGAPRQVTVSRVSEGGPEPLPSVSEVGYLGQLTAKLSQDETAYFEQYREHLTGFQAETKGTIDGSIRDTFTSGKNTLWQQRTDALESIDRELTAARAQLAAQRALVRETLTAQTDSAAALITDRAKSARASLSDAVRATQPHAETALERLRGSIAGAGLAPPEQLRRTAEIATDKVGDSLADAAGVQREQAHVIEASTRDGIAATARTTAADRTGYTADETTRLSEAEAATVAAFARTVDETLSRFPVPVDGMRDAGRRATEQLRGVRTYATEVTQKNRDEHLIPHGENVGAVADAFDELATKWDVPETEEPTAKALDGAYKTDLSAAENAVGQVGGAFDKIDATLVFSGSEEQELVTALRGFTKAKGIVFLEYWDLAARRNFFTLAREHLSHNNLQAARLYLQGRNAEAAAYELNESRGVFNDDEARMEGALRALNPAQLAELDAAEATSRTGRMRDAARRALDGYDAHVFDALRAGNYARADAYRFQEAQNRNLANRNADKAHETIRGYTSAPTAMSWGPNSTVTADQRRQMIANELAAIRNPGEERATTDLSAEEEQSNLQAMADFATGTYTYSNPYRPQDGSEVRTTWSGANHDLARDMILHGVDSRQAQAAQIGVEIERTRGPIRIENLDRVLYDPQLNPNTYPPDFEVPDHVREARLAARDEMLLEAHARYGVAGQSSVASDSEEARQGIIDRLTRRMGRDEVGQSLIAGMVNEPVPSPETASYAMEYAVRGALTNEAVIWRFAERMNRDELSRMGEIYERRTDENLHERLGLYGTGAGELSGQERMRGERVFRGMARTDREKAEAAIYAVRQQERETGGAGAAMAEGSLTNRIMGYNLARLEEASGGSVRFGAEGEARWSGDVNFDAAGTFTGDSNAAANFASAVATTEGSAKAYQSLIDHYAAQASLAITALGIIAAAVVTVATGGAAGPLLMAAIAGAAGLAGMAAKSAIRGGGYGWEEAAVDLGMTAVDMLTAGVGQGLSLASRGGMQAVKQGMRAGLSISAAQTLNRSLTGQMVRTAGKRALLSGGRLGEQTARGALLTGSKYGDQIAIGMIGGGIGGLGQAALDERTYDPYSEAGVLGNLLLGTGSGVLSGGITSGISGGVERLRIPGLGKTLEDLSENGTLSRGLVEAFSGGVGSFSGTGATLGVDALRGRFKGDLGDAFVQMGQEGLKNAAQGFGEGVGGAMRARADAAAAERLRARAEAHEAAERAAETGSNADAEAAERRGLAAEAEVLAAEARAAEGALPPARRAEAEAVARDTDGTAAGIAGAVMRGDFMDAPISASRTLGAAGRALRDPPSGISVSDRVRMPDREHIRMTGRSGQETDVEIRRVPELAPAEDGDVPVAQFVRETRDDGRTVYVVEVSGRAHEAVIARAIAHELAEIDAIETRRARGTLDPDAPDRLAPGAEAPDPDIPARDALSPHDIGRIAEFEAMARRLADVPPDSDEAAFLTTEAHRLAEHLGLTGDTDAAAARRRLAAEVAGADGPLLTRLALSASESPFAQPLRGTTEYVMGILADRLALAEKIDRMLGDDRRRTGKLDDDLKPILERVYYSETERVLREAGRVMLGQGMVVVNFRRANDITVTGKEIFLLHQKDPGVRHLTDRVTARLKDEDFRAFMRGRAEDRFRASYTDDGAPAAVEAATLDPDRRLASHALDGARIIADRLPAQDATVRDVTRARDALTAERDALVAAHTLSPSDEVARQIRRLNARINKTHEILGEVAARRVVEARSETMEDGPDFEEITFPGSGANLPDLVYRNKSGDDPLLLIIEAKGGEADLGTRQGLDPTRRVEQGTYEYLESLATSMTGKSRPPEVQALGEEILRLLRTEPEKIQYQRVQQPLPERGSALPAPEVGTFDLEPKSLPRGTIDRTAAAVPGSRFRADGGPRITDADALDAEIGRAANRMGGRDVGVGRLVGEVRQPDTAADGMVELTLTSPGRPRVTVVPVPPEGMARIRGDAAAGYQQVGDEFLILLSDALPVDAIERAIAHEVAEIDQLLRGNTETRDRLTDHPAAAGIDPDRPLTPHDIGRVAEIETLARDIAAAGEIDAARPREELGHLVRHLGLDDPSPAGRARRRAVADHLAASGVDLGALKRALSSDAPALRARIAAAEARLADVPDAAQARARLQDIAEDAEHALVVHSLGEDMDILRDIHALNALHDHVRDALADLIRPIDDTRLTGAPTSAETTAGVALRAWRRVFIEGDPGFSTYSHEYARTEGADKRTRFSEGGLEDYRAVIDALIPSGEGAETLLGDRFLLTRDQTSSGVYIAQPASAVAPETLAGAPSRAAFHEDVAFHQFHRRERVEGGAGPTVERIYLRTSADDAAPMMRDIVTELLGNPDDFPGVGAAKVAGAGRDPILGDGTSRVGGRNESIVIYLSEAEITRPRVAAWLAEDARRSRLMMGAAHVVPFAAPLVHGDLVLGSTADHPQSGGSFGQTRSAVVEATIKHFREAGIVPTPEAFMTKLRTLLYEAGIDPAAPHRARRR